MIDKQSVQIVDDSCGRAAGKEMDCLYYYSRVGVVE